MAKALFIEEAGQDPEVTIRDLDASILPEGDVDVDVLWSSLNYKDALAVTGRSPIVRAPFPFVPGIDLVGQVTGSRSDEFQTGDLVVQTGWGLGENRFGGFSEKARVKAAHLVPLPSGLQPREAMIIGTAGFTAMLACLSLEDHGTAEGPIVVTGASGGVGSFSVVILKALGYNVVASTGSGNVEYLKSLGADGIIPREDHAAGAARPMDSARWGGAVDSVGGATLEALISQTGTRGAVAACGLAGGSGLRTTVFPFILRGVGLLGIDSNTCPRPLRRKAWDRLSELCESTLLDRMATEIRLPEVPDHARALLDNRKHGRTVVRCFG